jgi:hypothetical protein
MNSTMGLTIGASPYRPAAREQEPSTTPLAAVGGAAETG